LIRLRRNNPVSAGALGSVECRIGPFEEIVDIFARHSLADANAARHLQRLWFGCEFPPLDHQPHTLRQA